jgi:hypothetical protein
MGIGKIGSKCTFKQKEKQTMAKVEQISELEETSKWVKLSNLAGFIMEFLAKLLNPEQVDYWLDHKSELKAKLREVFVIDELTDVRKEWAKFYKEKFNWSVDFSRVVIPSDPAPSSREKWHLVFIAKGLTPNFAFEIASKVFECKKSHNLVNLDNAVFTNCRNTLDNYAIWICDKPERYEGERQDSIPEFYERRKYTLVERIILEAKHFSETSCPLTNHLEVDVCAGSYGINNPSV